MSWEFLSRHNNYRAIRIVIIVGGSHEAFPSPFFLLRVLVQADLRSQRIPQDQCTMVQDRQLCRATISDWQSCGCRRARPRTPSEDVVRPGRVDGSAELLPLRLVVHLFNGYVKALTPGYRDSRIQVVQLRLGEDDLHVSLLLGFLPFQHP